MTENWNLLGNEWAVEMLKQHLVHDSIRHAYLFIGPPGLGRRTLALRFARALNCPSPVAPGEPCGKCRTCEQVERMQYSDLTVVQAEKEGGTLKVEQVRAVRQNLALKPFQGRYRVALFLRFQEANQNAANALLKTLEEAPAHAILILTADSAEQLLPTIVSRCEVLRLRPVQVDTMETYLRSHGAEAQTARLLARISGGRPGHALRLMQDKDRLEFRRTRLDDLQRMLRSTRRERFAYAEKLADRRGEGRENFRETLLLWLSFWRDVMLCCAQAERSGTTPDNLDRVDEISALAKRLSLEEARRLVTATEEGIERLEKNVNARLLAEVLLLDWPRLNE